MEIEQGDADAPCREPDQTEPPEAQSRAAALLGEVPADPGQQAAESRRYRALADHEYGKPLDRWAEAVPELRATWEKIKEKFRYEERDEPSPPPESGAWHGQGGRKLDAAQNEEIDRGYAGIREAGERTIIPGVLAVEAEDTTRSLTGFDNCFKSLDRLKEKVADRMRSKGQSAEEALTRIPDVVRFTYKYGETGYSEGVPMDLQRLEARGFIQIERRNTWDNDQYKGINSRWREPESGVMFEVQFHTQASFEAKELTHKAYERIRSITEQTPEADHETAELREFQRRANSMIPIPPGVADIDDYPTEGK